MFSVDPGVLFVNLVIGTVGFGVFLYGRKAQRVPQIVAGLLLMVYPYFTSTTTQTVVAGALIAAGLWGALWLGW